MTSEEATQQCIVFCKEEQREWLDLSATVGIANIGLSGCIVQHH